MAATRVLNFPNFYFKVTVKFDNGDKVTFDYVEVGRFVEDAIAETRRTFEGSGMEVINIVRVH